MSHTEDFHRMRQGIGLAHALAEADRCLLCYDAPCSKDCPAETDPGTFIRKLRLRNVTGAIRTIKRNNVLGGACGVLCPTHKLCEKGCSATGISRPIQIGAIQRFLVEEGWRMGFDPFDTPQGRTEKVAVVGSGPAGLSCAAELARQGFQVTVFEERQEIGGVIRYGVPAYRFDRSFLAAELKDLERLGVRFKTNARVDGLKGAKALLKDGFQAVFLSPGLWAAQRLGAGKKAPKAAAAPKAAPPKGVFSSVEYLASLRDERFAEVAGALKGKTVAVVGGGSVAMDCCESAARLGAADVYLVYRRSYAQMPAEPDEREEALSLGVHFLLLTQPVGYLEDKGRVTGLKLVRTRLGEPDSSGRRRPAEVPGSDWELSADLVIEAIGNKADEGLDWSPEIQLSPERLIVVDPKTGKTAVKGIYAGGDIVRGPGLVVEAVQDGKVAARAIAAALR